MTVKKHYRVREGVAWINGARVPADRRVMLTDREARFDLEQGRIEPVPTPEGKSRRRAATNHLARTEAAEYGRD